MRHAAAIGVWMTTLALAGPAGAADSRFRTETGVDVILVETRGFPIVNLAVHFSVGPAHDPSDRSGLTALTTRMLLRGTQVRGRAEFEEAVESLGTELHTGTAPWSSSLSASVLARNLDTFAALLGEALTKPAFDQVELDKVRREMLAELEADRDDDATAARKWFRRRLYGDHPFGQPGSGTEAGLRAITREDVVAHHARYFGRATMLIGASGDVGEARLRGLVDAWAAALPEGEAASWTFDPPERPDGRRVLLVDKADRSQVQLVIGHPTVPASHPDFYALNIATTAFGGTFTARLMEEVRVKRGWSYGAYARLGVERAGGQYTLRAAPSAEYAHETLALMLDEYRKLVDGGLTDEEIEFARNYQVNAFRFAVETPALRAGQLVRARLMGRDDQFVDAYVDRVRAVSAADVNAAVKRHLDPANLLAVMVCTAPPMRDKVADVVKDAAHISVTPYNAD